MIKARQAIYFIGLLSWFIQANADEEQTELPSMELLEFLGNAEKIDGEWLDPLDMIELQSDEQQTGQLEKQDND